MAVRLGTIKTFIDVTCDKDQALKPLEEAAEVYGAFQAMKMQCNADCHGCNDFCIYRQYLVNECADTIQAVCNLLESIDSAEMIFEMAMCEGRNMDRGREYAD